MGRKYGSEMSIPMQVQQQNNKNVSSVGLLNKSFSRQVIIIVVSILVVLILGIIGFFILFDSSKLSIKNASKVLKGWNYHKITVDEMLDLKGNSNGVYMITDSKDDVERYWKYGVNNVELFDASGLDKLFIGGESEDSYTFLLCIVHCPSEQQALNYFEQWKSNNVSEYKLVSEGIDNNIQYCFVKYISNDFYNMIGVYLDNKSVCIIGTTYVENESKGLRRVSDVCRLLGVKDLETTLSDKQSLLNEQAALQEALRQETLRESVDARKLADELKNGIVYKDNLSLVDLDTAMMLYHWSGEFPVEEAIFYEGTGVTAEEIVVMKGLDEFGMEIIEEMFKSRIEEQKGSYKYYNSGELRKLNMAVICTYKDWAILSVSDDSNKARDIINSFMNEYYARTQITDSVSVLSSDNVVVGRYVSEDMWIDADDNEFQPVILLHDDGTCQISYKYSNYALPSVDAMYVVDDKALKISWDGYNGWPGSNQHNSVSGAISNDTIMLQGSIFRKQ